MLKYAFIFFIGFGSFTSISYGQGLRFICSSKSADLLSKLSHESDKVKWLHLLKSARSGCQFINLESGETFAAELKFSLNPDQDEDDHSIIEASYLPLGANSETPNTPVAFKYKLHHEIYEKKSEKPTAMFILDDEHEISRIKSIVSWKCKRPAFVEMVEIPELSCEQVYDHLHEEFEYDSEFEALDLQIYSPEEEAEELVGQRLNTVSKELEKHPLIYFSEGKFFALEKQCLTLSTPFNQNVSLECRLLTKSPKELKILDGSSEFLAEPGIYGSPKTLLHEQETKTSILSKHLSPISEPEVDDSEQIGIFHFDEQAIFYFAEPVSPDFSISMFESCDLINTLRIDSDSYTPDHLIKIELIGETKKIRSLFVDGNQILRFLADYEDHIGFEGLYSVILPNPQNYIKFLDLSEKSELMDLIDKLEQHDIEIKYTP